MKATHKLWLTADKQHLVLDGDPRAAFLFCVPGGHIDDNEARRVGLMAGTQAVPVEEALGLTEPETEPAPKVEDLLGDETSGEGGGGESPAGDDETPGAATEGQDGATDETGEGTSGLPRVKKVERKSGVTINLLKED